jgi:hypothetical protein
MIRPDFSEIKTYEEFSKYYWYREELQKICKQLGIDASGMKADLNHNIEEYFKGNKIKPKPRQKSENAQETMSAKTANLTVQTKFLCNGTSLYRIFAQTLKHRNSQTN